MENVLSLLPEVTITEEEERAFDAAQTLIDYLSVYGARLSEDSLLRHIRYLRVTEPQIPALLDYACRRWVIGDSADWETSEIPCPRAVGVLMINRLEECAVPLREDTKKVLRLLFGLEDGPPLTLEETARAMDLSPDRVRRMILRACNRLSRNARNRGKRTPIRKFYT